MRLKNRIFGDKNSNNEIQVITSPEEYKKKGEEAVDVAWKILNSTDNWKLEKKAGDGETVYSKHLPGVGKVFKLSSEIDFPPKRLLEEIVFAGENYPKWNPSIVESRKLEVIDEFTHVSYQITGSIGGGLVYGRDFVTLIHWTMRGSCYVSAGATISHPSAPPNKKYIRAENGPNCWAFRSIPGAPDRCVFEFLLNTNLKGWVPQYAVDLALATEMIDHVKLIRDYVQKLKKEEKLDSQLSSRLGTTLES